MLNNLKHPFMKFEQFFLTVIILFFSLNNSQSQVSFAEISGIFEGAKDHSMVYFISNHGEKDSTYIKNGEYKCRVNADDWWDIYFVSCPSLSKSFLFPLFVRKGSSIHLNMNKELNQPVISGDNTAMEQNTYYQELNIISKPYLQILKRTDSLKNATNENLSNELIKIKKEVSDFHIRWVENHRSSPFSAAVIRLFIDKTNILKQIDTVATKCYDLLTESARENNYQSWLLSRLFAVYDDKYSETAIHQAAPPFTIPDTSGNYFSLSDFKGKWLLIDFWASWCGPCRKNNPLLNQLYQNYKFKGLQVLSISVDINKEKWKQAIQKDKMTWKHGSDLKGTDYGIGQLYQVYVIPYYLLISPEGLVVAKSIGGDIGKIESIIWEIFN